MNRTSLPRSRLKKRLSSTSNATASNTPWVVPAFGRSKCLSCTRLPHCRQNKRVNDVALLMVRTASPSLVSAMRAETKSKNSSSCTILRVPPVRHHPWQPSGARALKSTIPSVAHRHRRRRFPHRERTLRSTPFDERLWALNSSSAPRASWAFSSCATAAVGSRALATTTPTRRSRSTSPLNRRKHLLLSQTMALRSNNSITIIHYSSFVVPSSRQTSRV
mmetsp:Transcript_7679/g.28161  ORF Transcript_7679/g.28161 Transcript_7679/m.28161 type:complete len:220 (+) Transcript_7679:5652-6311(+)